MKRIPKHLNLSLRAILLLDQARKSFAQGLPQAAILYFTLYIEQLLITAACFVKRQNNITEAIQLRDTFFNSKQYFTFKRVTDKCINILVPYISAQQTLSSYNNGQEELNELKTFLININKIRNTVSAHIFFTVLLDPTNRKPWKRVLNDINYYKKVLRRLKRLIVDDLNLDPPHELTCAINYSGPMLVSEAIERMFLDAENEALVELARYCDNTSLQIRELLRVIIP